MFDPLSNSFMKWLLEWLHEGHITVMGIHTCFSDSLLTTTQLGGDLIKWGWLHVLNVYYTLAHTLQPCTVTGKILIKFVTCFILCYRSKVHSYVKPMWPMKLLAPSCFLLNIYLGCRKWTLPVYAGLGSSSVWHLDSHCLMILHSSEIIVPIRLMDSSLNCLVNINKLIWL